MRRISNNQKAREEDAVLRLIMERDAAPDGDLLTPRMEARRIIDTLDDMRGDREPGPEVNWADIGSVSPDDARTYAAAIVEAAEVAETLAGPTLDALAPGPVETTGEEA